MRVCNLGAKGKGLPYAGERIARKWVGPGTFESSNRYVWYWAVYTYRDDDIVNSWKCVEEGEAKSYASARAEIDRRIVKGEK